MSTQNAGTPPGHSVVDAQALQRATTALLEAAGLPAADAAITATSLVDADLRGVHSHGVIQLPGYLARLAAGGINPRPSLRVVSETPALAIVDGDGGMGQVVSHFAMELAIRKARQTGIGAVGVRNSEHFGACAFWAKMALAHDMIGIATTSGPPCMPPFGGTVAVLNNNPIGIAAPAGRELPVVLDIATSVVAQGKLKVAAARGEKIPPGWALGPDGQPTTDPIAGLQGIVLPIAGYKGFGLAFAFEVLAAIGTGALFGQQNPPDPAAGQPMRCGHFFQAIDVAAMLPVAEFKRRLDELIQQVRQAPRAPGVDRLYFPGELEENLKLERVRSGIPLPDSVLASLQQCTVSLGVAWPLTI